MSHTRAPIDGLVFADEEFRKASFSNYRWVHACVQVAIRSDGVGVRDSKDPAGATLRFTPVEWQAFIAGVKAGEFDV